MIKRKPTSLLCGLALALPLSASAQLFVENFDTDTSANWNVNVAGQAEATFGFDYSALGVPSAPNGSGTTGLHMRANWNQGAASGISVSPIGQSFTGDFVLKFDAWGNFAGGGDIASGAAGSTQNNGAGIGTAGTTAQWVNGTTASSDGVFFSTAADGWGVDYGAYTPAGLAAASAYPAGGTNDTAAHYQGIGGKEAPAAQVTLSAGQAGTTRAGASGIAWRQIEIAKTGDTVTWTMDGLLLATIENYSGLGVGGDNILFNFYDSYSSIAADPDNMQFGLIDNVQVIPEPSTYALFAGLGILGLAVWRRSRKTAA